MFGADVLTFREFMMGESLPLATVQQAVLEFLQGRDDVVVFGAQAVNAYVSEPRMTQDFDARLCHWSGGHGLGRRTHWVTASRARRALPAHWRGNRGGPAVSTTDLILRCPGNRRMLSNIVCSPLPILHCPGGTVVAGERIALPCACSGFLQG